MPWNKNGDTGGTHPSIMAVAGLRGYQPGDISMVAGFYWRLTNQSSAFTTDYLVDAGTVISFTEGNQRILKLATRVGLLTRVKLPSGLFGYQLLEDPQFVHIRSRAEIELARQQKADTTNLALAVPVRLRDGDLCRYCQVVTTWRGTMSPRRGTLDHLNPPSSGIEATVDTLVVACTGCNSQMRDMAGEERETLLPPPEHPFYTKTTAEWLTRNGRPTLPTTADDQRSGSRPANAQRNTATITMAQRPGSQPGHARTADSDSAPAEPRAATEAAPKQQPIADSNSFDDPEGMNRAGSGRDGPGSSRSSPTTNAGTARRKRSRRGRPRTGGPT